MKKILAITLAVIMVLGMAACKSSDDFDPSAKSEGTMTYAQFDAAELDSTVVVECFVQDSQNWYEDVITVYAQDPDGAYFLYKMACSQADSQKLVPGTKIKVTGTKTEWEGEVEIVDATFEIMEGNWIAEPMDATALLGSEELIKHQNKLASFKGMTIEKIEYKNGEPGDDIYITVSKDGASYDFCVEIYLTGEDTDVYKTVGTLKVGDVVDIQGFLYWYTTLNTHITGISLAK